MIREVRLVAGDDGGGVLVEYALVLALVSMVGLTALTTFGDVLAQFFTDTSATLAKTAELAR